ncbi:MAG: HAMP domain-containing protein [Woeseiaceae bacterium]|nr:HAMP domain-containing protein [Woeseiaceae bacterium]NIP19528.1 HAMP domain-containing protein [Woeseiaceae bacterium]NIS88483.1 HAMP domain-containing protein [Woeseiaceae bacterium]
MSNIKAKRSLQRKVSLRLSLAMTVFIVGVFLILRVVITPAFEKLELKAAHADLVRADQAIQTDIDNLKAITLDWGLWDDIYEYAAGRNQGFQRSNLDRSTLENLGLDMLAIYEFGGRLKWGELHYEGEDIPLEKLELLGAGQPAAKLLTEHATPDSGALGIVNTALGPMIISSQPILHNNGSGPVAGTLIMAQFANEARLERLRARTEVDMTWMLVEQYVIEGEHELSDIPIGELPVHLSDGFVTNCIVRADILGNPYLLVSTKTPRAISALGSRTASAALLFLVTAGVLLIVLLWWFMKRTIIQPIDLLVDHINKIRKSGDLNDKLNLDSDDELGILAMQYDKLTSEVHETRAALLQQSFKAGKADTAAEVLHNIRNAMTPMINGLDRLGKAFKITDSLHVKEAVENLSDPDCDPAKAEKFVQYLDASFDRIGTVHAEASEDLKVVSSQARQVEGILTDQEKFTNVAPVSESLVIDEVIEEASLVIPKDSSTEIEVEMTDELEKFRVVAHRIDLLQVLSNLILNAYESIQRAGRAGGKISLRACETVIDEINMVQLTVCDNGTGFDEEIRNKVFQRGFTSKSKGDTRGLGLHWCANAVSSMGGRIFADSKGEGQGAEFHVLLPAAQGG